MRLSYALPIVMSLAACERGGEPSSDAAVSPQSSRETGAYDVDGETGEINARIHRDDGSVATMRSGERVPVWLPEGFTLYPDAEIVSNTRVDHGGGRGVLLTMRSDAAPEQMAVFYRRQAESAGIAIDTEMEAGRSAMMAGRSPEGGALSFNATQDAEGTEGQLMITTADR